MGQWERMSEEVLKVLREVHNNKNKGNAQGYLWLSQAPATR
jgi:hypothetical protein